jgi:thymidylate kinase
MRLFVGLDGIDGAGKTTCVDVLRLEQGFSVYDEFTYTPLGDAIRGVISARRFFSMSDPPATRVADTMVLLSDWILKLEQAEADPAPVIVSDRSYLSVLGYQHARLCAQYSAGSLALESIARASSDVGRIVSSRRVINILLTITEEQLHARVAHRGERPLSSEQTRFLLDAQKRMLSLQPEYIIPAGDDGILAIATKVRALIASELSQ